MVFRQTRAGSPCHRGRPHSLNFVIRFVRRPDHAPPDQCPDSRAERHDRRAAKPQRGDIIQLGAPAPRLRDASRQPSSPNGATSYSSGRQPRESKTQHDNHQAPTGRHHKARGVIPENQRRSTTTIKPQRGGIVSTGFAVLFVQSIGRIRRDETNRVGDRSISPPGVHTPRYPDRRPRPVNSLR